MSRKWRFKQPFMARTHPGVSLVQKAQGGFYNVRFYDPRHERRQVKKSTETNDYDIASRIAEEIYRLIDNPDHWDSPPDGLHARTLKICGTKSLADRAGQAKDDLENPMRFPPQTKTPGVKMRSF